MKKRIQYSRVIQRENGLKTTLYMAFFLIASYPMLILEVFLRRSMGERHFNLSSALGACFVAFFAPIVVEKFGFSSSFDWTLTNFILTHWLYYLFLVLVMVFSYFRYKEIKREPSVFDFGKFSKCHGKVLPFFLKLEINGRKLHMREIETIAEPFVCLAIGLVVGMVLSASLGCLLVFCSITYSLAMHGFYMIGDGKVMDIIDRKIQADEMKNFFKPDGKHYPDRGTEYRMRMPKDDDQFLEVWRKLFGDDDDIDDVQ